MAPTDLVGGITRLWNEFLASSPFADYEYVTVTFNGADVDTDIQHHLSPPTPEDVDYRVVKVDRATSIYHDTTGTRRAWGVGFITLRSSTASAVATLLLTTRR